MFSPETTVTLYSPSAFQCHFIEINDKRILTVVTTKGEIADAWIDKIMKSHDMGYRLVVGFDMEVDATCQRIATLQFSVGTDCLIYRVVTYISPPFPEPLRKFLLDQENVVFVGVALRGRLKILRRWAEMIDNYIPYVELRDLAAYSYSSSNLNGAGLVKLAKVVLSLNLVRSNAIRRWTRRDLPASDVQYACVGAYMALQIGLVLTRPMPILATHSESPSESGN